MSTEDIPKALRKSSATRDLILSVRSAAYKRVEWKGKMIQILMSREDQNIFID